VLSPELVLSPKSCRLAPSASPMRPGTPLETQSGID